MRDTQDSIERIFEEILGKEALKGDLSKWNSLNHMRIIVEIEKDFGITFKPKEVVAASNLEKLIELVNLKRSQQAKSHE